jgi:UDP-N-acetylmuramate--alanine ligase
MYLGDKKGIIHFIGIGGIGVSALARIVKGFGYKVQGSNILENYMTKALKKEKYKIFIGDKAEHVLNDNIKLIVVSEAVPESSSEIKAGKEKGIPVLRRAEFLRWFLLKYSSIGVAGSHGKTTTSSMILTLLKTAKIDASFMIGGKVNGMNTNGKAGKSNWFVAEVCEANKTFPKQSLTIPVITNIDYEHAEIYKSYDEVKAAFLKYLDNTVPFGFGVLCADHKEVIALSQKTKLDDVVTYGLSVDADVRAINIELGTTSYFDVQIRDKGEKKVWKNFKMHIYGMHNIQNALAAISIGIKLGFSQRVIKKAVLKFKGADRRFTKVGEVKGVTIIDDYAHHPVEIEAVLKTAKTISKGKIITVFQPHLPKRFKEFFDDFTNCFSDTDKLIVADVYTPFGRGKVDPKYSKDAFVKTMKSKGFSDVEGLASPNVLPDLIKNCVGKNDMVLFLGAGDITDWAHALPKKLK